MENLKEHLKTLGITENSTISEIKSAYRGLVRVWHPDRFQSNPRLQKRAHTEIQKINEAYEAVLKWKGITDGLDDAFGLLGLTKTATSSEIKTAYRDLVTVWHPDHLPDDPMLRLKAEQETARINDAYEKIQAWRELQRGPIDNPRAPGEIIINDRILYIGAIIFWGLMILLTILLLD